MKLIIQIPCYNEEKTLPITLRELPRQVEGFSKVEWLLIDDGSRDRSIEVAIEHGIDHVVKLNTRRGLAEVFRRGLDACIQLDADVIVNTDADNQYNAADIPKLVKPILEKKAEIVVGARPISDIPHFSPIKKGLQKLGSWAVRRLSYASVPDAPSGFRAISREAAMQLNVFNSYTYTLETLIQAGNKNITTQSVPIRVNEELRPSKLVKSVSSYVMNSIITIFRIFVVYRPFKTFMMTGLLIFFIGVLLGLRYVYFMFIGEGLGHVQLVVLVGVLLGFGFQTMIVAFLADLLAVNRFLLEDVQLRSKRICLEIKRPAHSQSLQPGLHETVHASESDYDPLTRLYTRQYLDKFLEWDNEHKKFFNTCAGALMIRIDQLQAFRKNYGVDVMEDVLLTIGTFLRSDVRDVDLVCRYDDETFLMLLSNASLRVTKRRAEELQENVKHLVLGKKEERTQIILIFSVAALPEHGSDINHVIESAENLLIKDGVPGSRRIVIAC